MSSGFDLLTIREFARLIGVSISSAYQIASNGELPTYRLGARRGAIRVARRDVDTFLSQRRVEGKISRTMREIPRGLKHLRIPKT